MAPPRGFFNFLPIAEKIKKNWLKMVIVRKAKNSTYLLISLDKNGNLKIAMEAPFVLAQYTGS